MGGAEYMIIVFVFVGWFHFAELLEPVRYILSDFGDVLGIFVAVLAYILEYVLILCLGQDCLFWWEYFIDVGSEIDLVIFRQDKLKYKFESGW